MKFTIEELYELATILEHRIRITTIVTHKDFMEKIRIKIINELHIRECEPITSSVQKVTKKKKEQKFYRFLAIIYFILGITWFILYFIYK